MEVYREVCRISYDRGSGADRLRNHPVSQSLSFIIRVAFAVTLSI